MEKSNGGPKLCFRKLYLVCWREYLEGGTIRRLREQFNEHLK